MGQPLAIARLLANMAELHAALHRLPIVTVTAVEGPPVERR
jgi:hypothetical protein